MIKYKKGGVLEFTGEDLKCVKKLAKERKLTVKEVVYLALINGIAGGYFEKAQKLRNKA